jgi:hypothetical protein
MKYYKKGGSLFEMMYIPLIQFCIEYNNRDERLLGEGAIVHIKGGASIKYHLNKLGINTNGITSDIDILLIPNGEENALNNFYTALQEKFTGNIFSFKNNNGLYHICINDICIFDITMYHSEINQNEDDETSMFLYALKNLEFLNINDYVDKLLEQSNTETQTFTTLQFEYFSTWKGIENTIKYLNSIEKWRSNKLQYESINPRTPNINRIIARLNYQTTPDYIAKLQDKKLRYIQKYQTIQHILFPP